MLRLDSWLNLWPFAWSESDDQAAAALCSYHVMSPSSPPSSVRTVSSRRLDEPCWALSSPSSCVDCYVRVTCPGMQVSPAFYRLTAASLPPTSPVRIFRAVVDDTAMCVAPLDNAGFVCAAPTMSPLQVAPFSPPTPQDAFASTPPAFCTETNVIALVCLPGEYKGYQSTGVHADTSQHPDRPQLTRRRSKCLCLRRRSLHTPSLAPAFVACCARPVWCLLALRSSHSFFSETRRPVSESQPPNTFCQRSSADPRH